MSGDGCDPGSVRDGFGAARSGYGRRMDRGRDVLTWDQPAEASLPRAPMEEFGFRFNLVHRLAGAAFLISPATTSVVLDHVHEVLVARFGPWRVATALSNIESTTVTGPYPPTKTVGPPHVSLANRGLTFATNDRRGLCIRFRSPVPGVEPFGLLRHLAITVTVDDVPRLQAALAR